MMSTGFVLEVAVAELPGMPDIAVLRLFSVGGETTVSFGSRLVFRYQDDDTGMRNLAIVALTDAGVEGLEVARVFGLSAPYVSRIRGEARRNGAQGLVKRVGRPRKLSDRQNATDIFSTLVGGPARRYDDRSVLSSAVTGFALGIDAVEGSKHLRRADAGALVGVSTLPELRTLRCRLSALADHSDPLALQRAFAKATLAADPAMSPVYYVDDHFVAYTGGRPVAKGYNTKRRHAESGRDDTLVCDVRGRAVVFASSEPSGLSATMPSVLGQLREVVGPDQPIMLGFDRGGSYPKAFAACRDAGMDWITYRRGKLAPVDAPVTRSRAMRGERRVVVHVADEVIDITGYGKARQLTLVEQGEGQFQ